MWYRKGKGYIITILRRELYTLTRVKQSLSQSTASVRFYFCWKNYRRDYRLSEIRMNVAITHQ